MCAYVFGVVRSAKRLDTLTFETRDSSDPACPWREEHASELRPLSQSARPELWTAWQALESVSDWDEATLGHVLTILRETVPCADVPDDLAALGPEVHAPSRPRATAAHPRAFRGTKYRPPRPSQPDSIDVRPYLLTRRHTDQVLELLGQPRGIDPYVAWNHRVDASAAFDPMFVMHLLPLFRECVWSDVGAFASLARTLQLHVEPELRAALIGVYRAADDPTRALGWWSHVLAHDAEHRIEIAKMVSASGVAKLQPLGPTDGVVVAALPSLQQWSFYRGLAVGASPAYLISGLELGAFSTTDIDEPPPHGKESVTSIIESTIERLGTVWEEDSGSVFWRSHLWRLCGQQPELIEVLASPEFVALEAAAAFSLLRLANTPSWPPETAVKQRHALVPKLPLLVEFASRVVPEYQRKFVDEVGEVYWWAIDNDHDVADALAHCVDTCWRVSKPPFGTKAAIGFLLPSMALILSSSWGPDSRAIRDAPDASWLALEDACKRVNQTRLLLCGLNRLSQFAPRLLALTFPMTPGALLQTADLVAAVSFETAEHVLKADAASPLADPAIADAPVERLCELIDPIAQAGGPNPVRRALRLHFSRDTVLSDAQLRGHRDRVVEDLGMIRLAAIRQAIERALAARVGLEKIETSTARHALAMLDHVEIHRRQLRRMLAAHLAGDPGWRLRHARTKEWFARHPKLDRDLWLAGLETRGEIAGTGDVRIAVETDPLEALKLGTYVGSCLGRGGNLEYSAAAVVLDVNKLVVYARDSRGSVVGRQLIALSESEELVCFRVYGAAKAELIQPLFREFDQAFAARLGVPVFNGSGECEIASILSHEWWNDSAWLE